MSFAAALSYLAAICAGGLALALVFRGGRSVAPMSFVAGMAAFALESLFSGLTAEAVLPESVATWQNMRLAVLAVLPGIWLLFSLTYARADARAFLAKWYWVGALVVTA